MTLMAGERESVRRRQPLFRSIGRSGGPSVLPEIYNAYKVRESEWSDFVLDDAVIESARVQTWETSETWGKLDFSLADWLADPSKSCHEMVGKELEARDFF